MRQQQLRNLSRRVFYQKISDMPPAFIPLQSTLSNSFSSMTGNYFKRAIQLTCPTILCVSAQIHSLSNAKHLI
jgi:hypothetical protein